MKQVGIWIRVSTEDQAEGQSPEHHEARARMYAEVKGWQVATVYDLSGVSGKTVWEHTECRRMREDIAAGRIEALIFSKLARLARNKRELLDFADFFRDEGADLVSLDEAIDTSTPAGRFFYTLLAAMAEWEREEIAERVRASVPIRAKLGKRTGGQASYGYRWTDEGLELEPDEAPVRTLMFDLFLKERRVGTVVRRLNEAGHRTRRGGKWTRSSVRVLLQDPTAKGKHRANYSYSGDANAKRLKPESEWVYQDCPAVVSADTFDAVAAIFADRKTGRQKQPAKRVRHLFAGRLFCTCGGKMYVPSGSRKYTCQDCRAKIPAEDLEAVFIEELSSFAASPSAIEAHLAEVSGGLAEKRRLLAAMRKSREEVSSEMDKLYRLYMEDMISPRQFGEKNRPLEARRDELDREIPRLQGEIDALAVSELSEEYIRDQGLELARHWQTLPDDDKRVLVEATVNRIEVGGGEIVFDLHGFPLATPSLETATKSGNIPRPATDRSATGHAVNVKTAGLPCQGSAAFGNGATDLPLSHRPSPPRPPVARPGRRVAAGVSPPRRDARLPPEKGGAVPLLSRWGRGAPGRGIWRAHRASPRQPSERWRALDK
jgi:site-specific DNA recombinase